MYSDDPMTQPGGFTLLELLMVVVIITILSSVALPQYLRVAERVRSVEALTIMAAIRSAESRYKAQHPSNLYTKTLTDLDTDIPPSSLWTYSVDGTTPGSNAQAARSVGAQAGKIIQLDLDTGASCSDAGFVYGLTNGLGC